jgi:hypothetical protein
LISQSPLDESVDNKSTKFEVRIQDPRSTARRPKKPRKAQEGHLEEGKPQKPTKGTKMAKPSKMAKKR